MSDYDARRLYEKHSTTIPLTKPKNGCNYIYYMCPNSRCRYSWGTIKGQECTVCSQCGTPGIRE